MSRATMVRTVCVVAVAATVLLPTVALAQRGGGGGRGAGGGGRIISAPTTITGPGPIQVGPTPFPQNRGFGVHGRGHHVGHHHHRNFVGKGFVGFAPAFWGTPYYYPYYYDNGYDPGLAYPPTYTVVAPQRPMQTVVEYPTGRYELRGDGYGTPYHWLWIPNAPMAPPTPAPPAFQPAPEAPPASTKPEPPGRTTVYRWTDAQGVTHFTDRLDSVPAQFRPQNRSPRGT